MEFAWQISKRSMSGTNERSISSFSKESRNASVFVFAWCRPCFFRRRLDEGSAGSGGGGVISREEDGKV